MEHSQITFRQATPEDADTVTQLMQELSLELPISHVDNDVIKTSCDNLITLPNVKAYLAEKDGEVIGGMGFILGNELWSRRIIAYEAFWYMRPEHRGGTGIKLLKYVEKHIDSDIIDLGIYNPRLRKLLIRMGYRFDKAILTKEL